MCLFFLFFDSRSGAFEAGGRGINGRVDSINVGFHYLSAYREVAAAAGARGTARDETGSARRVHTQNTFPLKQRGTEGVKKRLKKKEKEERRRGRARGSEGANLKKRERCHPVD